MTWLHTWAGIVVGALLFAIFWMGTLSVFDREIDRWMIPETRLPVIEASPSLDAIATVAAGLVQPDSRAWLASFPTDREPVVRLFLQDSQDHFTSRFLDPATGLLLPEAGSRAGSDFIFPFHYNLNLEWMHIGYWLVGLLGMAMLTLIVSGVLIHRKIFVNFFTFRPNRKLPRSSLDLHNLTGVVALPFHFIITLSGLIIFFSIHFPGVVPILYQDREADFLKEAYGVVQREAAGAPGELASLDDMMEQAFRLWDGGRPYFVRIWHPGDANSIVEMRRSFTDSVTLNLDAVYFDGPSGAILHSHTAKPVMTVQRFLSGLHFIQFEHWALRWLYFGLGLSGCVMIATGFIHWLETRRKRHATQNLPGLRIVEGLSVGAVTGIITATLAFFVANRLLPAGATFLGIERHALEIWAFYLVWLVSFAHAWSRPGRAWREQCWAIAGLALLAVLLNALTTGDHLARSLTEGLWAVAGMDLMLLAGAAIAALTAGRLRRRTGAQRPADRLMAAAEARR
ncbi:MAG: PepSY domain-containing protein [Kiloniellales bacterium]|nr:PepSY domain-containing protein [Kiloniellales bacterium]